MKKLLLVAAVSALSVAPMLAKADTASGAFTVSVLFTPKCTITSAAPTIAFTYTAFDAAAGPVALSNPIALQCSRGFGNTVSAAFGEGGAAEGLIGTATSTNLRYTLSAITKNAVGPGNAATASSNGTADTTSFSFTGTLPQQAGNGTPNTPATAVTAARTLVVTF